MLTVRYCAPFLCPSTTKRHLVTQEVQETTTDPRTWRQNANSLRVPREPGGCLHETHRYCIMTAITVNFLDPAPHKAQKAVTAVRRRKGHTPMETPVSPPNPPYAPYAPPAAPSPKSKTPVVVVALLGACGCGLLMIPILAAILFPVFAQAREKARQVSCLSNEKQMALGVMMYAQDYDETYPAAPQWITQDRSLRQEPCRVCLPQRGQSRADTRRRRVYVRLQQPTVEACLGVCESAPTDGNALRLVCQTENASDALTSLPVPGRHQGRNNVAFGDGHAKSLDSLQIQESLFDAGVRAV